MSKEKRELRDKVYPRVTHRSCFWTWPWGHIWVPMGASNWLEECATSWCDAIKSKDPL